MKKIFVLTCLLLLLAGVLEAQNGIFYSSQYVFRSENEPHRNRTANEVYGIVFQINELHGQFINGRVLWELRELNKDDMSKDEDSAWMEMNLISMKNSYFDRAENAFVKSFNAEIKFLDVVSHHADVFIWHFVNTNKYRLDLYDPRKKTLSRWNNLSRMD